MEKKKKLVIFGDSAFAEVAYQYFKLDSVYDVCGFCVSKEYLNSKELFGLPIVPFEDVDVIFPPDQHEMYVALVYNSMNRIRTKFFLAAKEKKYKMASYISSKAWVWPNVELGEHNFVFENNVIQPYVKVGHNNVFWSGNHIGHHSKIGSNNFLSSHVVVSGFSEIGDSNFFGVNCTFGNNLKIGNDNLIGAGALIVKDLGDGNLIKGNPSKPDPVSTYEKFGLTE